ncbi:helix-turn-helix domain-containing protein, partial [Streptomyces sp. SKN60]
MAGSPTARRRRLSIELKKLRETSGFTCAQVGAALDWSGSKVNRMETGTGRVQPSDVDALCRF